MNNSNNRLVYSTDIGRINHKSVAKVCQYQGDGIVRIQCQTKGRKGKGVCVISGIHLDEKKIIELTTELKKRSGCGGTVKKGVIEIQGDKRDLLKNLIEAKGMKVKLVGG